MERLTIEEVINHCENTTQMMERVFSCIHDGEEFGQIESKSYLKHKQVAEWLKELQSYKVLEESLKLKEDLIEDRANYAHKLSIIGSDNRWAKARYEGKEEGLRLALSILRGERDV